MSGKQGYTTFILILLGFHTYEVSLHVKVFNSGVFHRFLERIAAIPTVRLNRELQHLEACLNYNSMTNYLTDFCATLVLIIHHCVDHFGLDYSSLCGLS